MNVLVINSGSSSVKFELFAMDSGHSLIAGEVQRIGERSATLWREDRGGEPVRIDREVDAPDHSAALDVILGALDLDADARDLAGVGHRVVHGGERFAGPVLIDDAVVDDIADLARLAPLHTAANLVGIEATRNRLPHVPQVAVFDTTFHRTIPPHAREYALPRAMTRKHGIRRYGFHGTSHAYVAGRAAALLGRSADSLNLITLHLGNGGSVTASRGGESIDTSMGMTPLEGLVMGTRCGDIDPAVPLLLREIEDCSREDVHRILNHESGLLGLCGESDMREVHRMVEAGDENAGLALDIFCYRIKKYIGAYCAVLEHVDGIVFTGGIGENDPDVRARVCAGLGAMGIDIDPERNDAPGNGERAIQRDGSAVALLVIPTDEELEIARLTLECIRGTG
ncbi:MAG: acetate/propionate family kinase [Coriobacteriia bacterium]